MSEPGRGENTTWTIATRRGWRKSIRRMMTAIKPRNESKLVALRQSGTGVFSVEAGPGQRFSPYREDDGASVSSAGKSSDRQHEQPAATGVRE